MNESLRLASVGLAAQEEPHYFDSLKGKKIVLEMYTKSHVPNGPICLLVHVTYISLGAGR